MKQQHNKLLWAFAACGILAACNGGGGDDSTGGQKTTSAVVLTEANQQQVAKNALGAADTASTVSGSGLSLVAGVRADTPPQQVQWPVLLVRKGLQLMEQKPAAGGLVGGAVIQDSIPCTNGGSIAFSLNDVGAEGPSAGDSVTASFINCSEMQSGVNTILNGNFTLSFNQVSDTRLSSGNMDLTMTIPEPGLSVGVTEAGVTVTTTVAGDMSMQMQVAGSNVSMTVASNKLRAATSNGETLNYANFRMGLTGSASGDSLRIDGDIGASSKDFSGSYTLNMSQPDTPLRFSGRKSYPDSGELRIKGANGTLTVTVQPLGMVLLTLTADGKTTTKTVNWCSIDAC